MSRRPVTAARAVAWSLISIGLTAAGCSLTVDFSGLAGGAAPDGGAGYDGSSEASAGSGGSGGLDAQADSPGDAGSGSCPVGHANCDSNTKNGCEVDIRTDISNCGACGAQCSKVNGTPSCNASQCSIACDQDFADCDNDVKTGCETDTSSDPTHCGDCATACSTVNDTPTCAAGQCSITCATGYADCDNDVKTGCEIDTTSDVAHCGDCATACSTVNNTPTCTAGKCVLACDAGSGDCDKDVTTGCETNTTNDPDNCGACGTVCPKTGGTPSCTASKCSLTCAGNNADCNGVAADGCEVNLASDKTNCGTCGHDCEGGACSGGVCQPVVIAGPSSQMATLSGLAMDANNVYFTAQGNQPNYVDGGVFQVPRHGGAPVPIATGTKSPWAVAPYGGKVYFSNAGTPGSGYSDGSIASVPVGGGSISVIQSGLFKPWGIAADAVSVYWVENGAGTLSSCIPANCASTTTQLASGLGSPKWMVLASGFLYWTNSSGGTVTSCSIAGCSGTPTVLASPGAAASPTGIAVDAQRVYWTNYGASTVQSVKLNGTSPLTIASSQSGPSGVTVDAANVYWTDATAGQVMTAKLSGGAASPVAAASYPTNIVGDATQLFWINFGNGTVVKLVK